MNIIDVELNYGYKKESYWPNCNTLGYFISYINVDDKYLIGSFLDEY